MGQPQRKRVARPKKRGWNVNQHTGPVRNKKVVEHKSQVDTEASTSTINTSDESVNTPSKSPQRFTWSKTCWFQHRFRWKTEEQCAGRYCFRQRRASHQLQVCEYWTIDWFWANLTVPHMQMTCWSKQWPVTLTCHRADNRSGELWKHWIPTRWVPNICIRYPTCLLYTSDAADDAEV